MNSSTTFSPAKLQATFVSVCVIFLMVGFAQFTTGTLVDYLKGLFHLSNFEAQLISLAFFIAYFVMALPAERLLSKLGYKWGIVIGLMVCAAGALFFIPASMVLQYWAFLAAVLLLGLGVATLQVGINPYVAVLGDEKSAASRVSIANGCTALGSILAPQAAKYLLPDTSSTAVNAVLSPEQVAAQASVVQMPFGVVALIFVGLAVFLGAQKLPEPGRSDDAQPTAPFSIGQYPFLVWGILTLALYMSAQISVINLFFKPFLQQYAGLTLTQAGDYLSLFFLLQMVGRFAGSALMRTISPGILLVLSGIGMAASLLAAPYLPGGALPYLFAGIGLFDAICFGNVFSIAIRGMGVHTKLGSSFLFMSVVGGAIGPALIGALVDATSMTVGLALVAVSYLLVGYYGFVGRR